MRCDVALNRLTMTVHAPHPPSPHANLVPYSPTATRECSAAARWHTGVAQVRGERLLRVGSRLQHLRALSDRWHY